MSAEIPQVYAIKVATKIGPETPASTAYKEATEAILGGTFDIKPVGVAPEKIDSLRSDISPELADVSPGRDIMIVHFGGGEKGIFPLSTEVRQTGIRQRAELNYNNYRKRKGLIQ